jgi:hypothetical protein
MTTASSAKITSKAGAHIGLTQVLTTEVDAWNRLQNATDGVLLPSQKSTQAKLKTAYTFATELEEKYEGSGNTTAIPAKTSCQLEEMALELYGPHPGSTKTEQYYAGQCNGGTGSTCAGGSWQWAINKPATPQERCAVCYVAQVRSEQPTGSTSSSCLAKLDIPADPPAVANLKVIVAVVRDEQAKSFRSGCYFLPLQLRRRSGEEPVNPRVLDGRLVSKPGQQTQLTSGGVGQVVENQ